VYNLIPNTNKQTLISSHFVISLDLETRKGYIKKWEGIEALADRSKRAQQLNEEINRIVELVAEGKETVHITPVILETGKKLSANKALDRLYDWLGMSYPTATPIKKKKAPAKKKRKSKEPATKSEATKKKRANTGATKPCSRCSAEKTRRSFGAGGWSNDARVCNRCTKAAGGAVLAPAVSEPTADPEEAAKLEKAKKAKLDAAIASAKSSSDGKVGATELKAALDAGYSQFFVLDQAKEEMK